MTAMSEKIRRYPGKELTSEDLAKAGFPSVTFGEEFKYSWGAGVALGRFLDELKNGRVIGRRCNKCGRVLVPPRMYCEIDFSSTDEWVFVEDAGTVNTFSISYVSKDAGRLKEPQIPAVIELDGASKGMGILHVLGEVSPDKVSIGMRVKAVWKKPGDRTGSITDILYFKPL